MSIRVILNIVAITLPDAVNFVKKVTNQELQLLGHNLGLPDARVQEIIKISNYDLNEQHQRLVELWFTQDSEPTWEKLRESCGDPIRRSTSLYRRESSTSTISVPNTPCSPKGEILQ